MSTDRYVSPLSERYASKEILSFSHVLIQIPLLDSPQLRSVPYP